MSAADLAASVAPSTAIPASACFSAGASFTPSPVIATMWPFPWSSLTMRYLCSGNTSAKPSAFSITSTACSSDNSVKLSDEIMSVPSPTCWAISCAMAVWSPVTIFMSSPIFFPFSIVWAESSRGGSASPISPSIFQPPPSWRATPSVLEPRAAMSLTSWRTRSPIWSFSSARPSITCGAPFATRNSRSSFDTWASVRFITGSKGTKSRMA